MYKIIAIALLGFILIQPTNAQDRQERKAEIEALKTDFFNRELQLSEDEQKVFWPLYNKFHQDRKERRGDGPRPKLELMSDAEVEKHIDKMFDREEQRIAEKKQLYQALKGKLAIRKIAHIAEVEKKFKRALVRKVKEKRKHGAEGKRKIRR